MGPIDILKYGIEKGDWEKVCEAYNSLSGKTLYPPQTPSVGITSDNLSELYEDITKLYRTYQSLNQTIEEVVEEKKVDAVKTAKKPGRPKKQQKVAVKTKKTTKPVEEVEDDEEGEEIKAGPKTGMVKGQVDASQNKMHFPTDSLVDEKEKEINAKAFATSTKLKGVIKKPKYRPNLIKCMFCPKTFDSNLAKNQIGAIFDKGDNHEIKTRCPHCRKPQVEVEEETE